MCTEMLALLCVCALVSQAVGSAINPLQWIQLMEVMQRSNGMDRSNGMEWLDGMKRSKVVDPSEMMDWQMLVQSGSDLYKTREVKVTDGCWNAMTQCSNNTMVSGRCKSTANGFLLDWMRNDVDVNCYVNGDDFVADVNNFFDVKPRDGQTCMDEWSDRRTEYNGYSRDYTDFEWEVVAGGRGNCIKTDSLTEVPNQSLKTEFANFGISRLVSFCKQGNNMATNRDCLGLPVICRDQRPDLEACRELPSDVRSLKQKLDQNQRMNDPNGDGRSEVAEVWGDISDHYDVDNNGCATETEWRRRWTAFYGFTDEFARAFYAAVNDGDDCANRDDVERNLGLNGVESSFFPNTLMSVIVGFCEARPDLYLTNRDCAMAADTCLNYFRDNPACQVYVEQCGPARYRQCVSGLPLAGQCRGDQDKAEVHMEGHRLDNLVNTQCRGPRETCRKENESLAAFQRLFGKY